MCGIVACRTNQPAVDYLTIALRRLEYRGYDSVGVAVQTASGDAHPHADCTGRIPERKGGHNHATN
jgi:glutamine---fructose-6-phosphate transaminase (isomerizing)